MANIEKSPRNIAARIALLTALAFGGAGCERTTPSAEGVSKGSETPITTPVIPEEMITPEVGITPDPGSLSAISETPTVSPSETSESTATPLPTDTPRPTITPWPAGGSEEFREGLPEEIQPLFDKLVPQPEDQTNESEATEADIATWNAYMEAQQAHLTSEAVPTPTAEETPGAVTKVNLNMRIGPGIEYDRIGGIPKGTSVEVVAKAPNGWLQVRFVDGKGVEQSAWVSGASDYITTNEKVEELQALSLDELPPTPTPEPPTVTPQPTPTIEVTPTEGVVFQATPEALTEAPTATQAPVPTPEATGGLRRPDVSTIPLPEIFDRIPPFSGSMDESNVWPEGNNWREFHSTEPGRQASVWNGYFLGVEGIDEQGNVKIRVNISKDGENIAEVSLPPQNTIFQVIRAMQGASRIYETSSPEEIYAILSRDNWVQPNSGQVILILRSYDYSGYGTPPYNVIQVLRRSSQNW
ncbi:MAG: SH3 domain-containing protein [Patescibacteria group bacterium]|jgi:hypothetical protein